MTTVHAIGVPGQGARINLYDRTAGSSGEGELRPLALEDGWAAAELTVEGRHGARLAGVSLTVGAMRQLADRLGILATFTEARAAGLAGPCLCSAWSHNVYPCPNAAAIDYSMCRECWTPESGQSRLTMGHGEPAH